MCPRTYITFLMSVPLMNKVFLLKWRKLMINLFILMVLMISIHMLFEYCLTENQKEKYSWVVLILIFLWLITWLGMVIYLKEILDCLHSLFSPLLNFVMNMKLFLPVSWAYSYYSGSLNMVKSMFFILCIIIFFILAWKCKKMMISDLFLFLSYASIYPAMYYFMLWIMS